MAGIAYRRIGDWRTQAPQQLRIQLAQQEATIEQLVQLGRRQGLTLDEHQAAIEALQQSTAQMRSELDALQAYTPVQCSVGFTGNTTETTITTSGAFETVTQATWVLDSGAVDFEIGVGDTSLVYTGETGRRAFWALTCNIRMGSGTLQEIWFRLAQGGNNVGHYAARMLVAQQSEQQDQLHGLLELTNGDEFTLEVRNESNTNNITARRMSLQFIEVH